MAAILANFFTFHILYILTITLSHLPTISINIFQVQVLILSQLGTSFTSFTFFTVISMHLGDNINDSSLVLTILTFQALGGNINDAMKTLNFSKLYTQILHFSQVLVLQ